MLLDQFHAAVPHARPRPARCRHEALRQTPTRSGYAPMTPTTDRPTLLITGGAGFIGSCQVL
ncbi:hypothetical protein, partial [uncultured Desulfovibrio sp.]|uniref:hypothetical protein n=1 Tax=uncultured Desulfovibrio sp. TaxID=167968 RepID=UPI00266D569C